MEQPPAGQQGRNGEQRVSRAELQQPRGRIDVNETEEPLARQARHQRREEQTHHGVIAAQRQRRQHGDQADEAAVLVQRLLRDGPRVTFRAAAHEPVSPALPPAEILHAPVDPGAGFPIDAREDLHLDEAHQVEAEFAVDLFDLFEWKIPAGEVVIKILHGDAEREGAHHEAQRGDADHVQARQRVARQEDDERREGFEEADDHQFEKAPPHLLGHALFPRLSHHRVVDVIGDCVREAVEPAVVAAGRQRRDGRGGEIFFHQEDAEPVRQALPQQNKTQRAQKQRMGDDEREQRRKEIQHSAPRKTKSRLAAAAVCFHFTLSSRKLRFFPGNGGFRRGSRGKRKGRSRTNSFVNALSF